MAALCEIAGCGVLAVGRCATCGRAFCTSHRAVVRDAPVPDRCVECQRLREDDRALRSERSRRRHSGYIADLASMPPSVDRLVRTLQYLAALSLGRTPKTGPLRFEPIIHDFYPELAYVCPEVWPGGAGSVDLLRPPWDSAAIAVWFLARVRDTGKPPNSVLKGWVTTRERWHGYHSQQAPPMPAWRFHEGSTTHVTEVDARLTHDRRCDAYVVAADGRVLRDYEAPCDLSARALVMMAQLLWGPPPKPWDV